MSICMCMHIYIYIYIHTYVCARTLRRRLHPQLLPLRPPVSGQSLSPYVLYIYIYIYAYTYI